MSPSFAALSGGFFPRAFSFVFVLVLVVIVLQAVRGFRQHSRNNASPVLTVDAHVVAKREHVSDSSHMVGDTMFHDSNTTYYATFEVESGDRMEFGVPRNEYGLIAEGDVGRLTFQGTWYRTFTHR